VGNISIVHPPPRFLKQETTEDTETELTADKRRSTQFATNRVHRRSSAVFFIPLNLSGLSIHFRGSVVPCSLHRGVAGYINAVLENTK
jgi:hypothetical protein